MSSILLPFFIIEKSIILISCYSWKIFIFYINYNPFSTILYISSPSLPIALKINPSISFVYPLKSLFYQLGTS